MQHPSPPKKTALTFIVRNIREKLSALANIGEVIYQQKTMLNAKKKIFSNNNMVTSIHGGFRGNEHTHTPVCAHTLTLAQKNFHAAQLLLF